MTTKRDPEVIRYEENVGKPAETRFPDDPDWKYRGTKDEREALKERIGDPEKPVVIDGQEELFS